MPSILKTIAAGAVCLAAKVQASIYDRPLHIVYADDGGRRLTNQTDTELQTALGQVKNNITAFCPFFLNVGPDSLPQYTNMIDWAERSNIVLFPAVGGPTTNGAALNTEGNQKIAQGYKAMVPGNRIRLENLTGFYSNNASDVVAFIDYCIQEGFENIMLNPWPYSGGGNLATFPSRQMPYLQSAFQQVDPTTWEINPNIPPELQAIQPGIEVVVNYESPGPQDTLAQMEEQKSGSSETIFAKTIANLETYSPSDNLHWCPPFTAQYDPLDFNPPTWPYIVEQLDKFQS